MRTNAQECIALHNVALQYPRLFDANHTSASSRRAVVPKRPRVLGGTRDVLLCTATTVALVNQNHQEAEEKTFSSKNNSSNKKIKNRSNEDYFLDARKKARDFFRSFFTLFFRFIFYFLLLQYYVLRSILQIRKKKMMKKEKRLEFENRK